MEWKALAATRKVAVVIASQGSVRALREVEEEIQALLEA
jgi:hypothetical protein